MVQLRKDALTTNMVYHIFTRSIAKFVIFNDPEEYDRCFQLLDLYRYSNFEYKFSKFTSMSENFQKIIVDELKIDGEVLVEIIAYCIMPTHIHLILKQIEDNGISKFMGRVLNGYSRYFNTKHGRVGPLWSGRFKNVLVQTDEQLIHLTRYIHLNPTSSGLVNKPEDWNYSSYLEYIGRSVDGICNYSKLIDMKPRAYAKFVDDHKSYQRDLSIIKSVMIDNYSG